MLTLWPLPLAGPYRCISWDFPLLLLKLPCEALVFTSLLLTTSVQKITQFSEIVLSSVSPEDREEFSGKTIRQLSSDEKELLRTYFSLEMSLADTAEKLFLHKNTLQYKLNHIYKKCGLNPRKFRDAVLLYLALEME